MTEREDQDLRSYLDDRFDQIDRRFEQVDKRFEQVDRRFEQVDKRLDGMPTREEMQAGLAENRRHFSVVAESLEANVQLLAEGHETLLDGQKRIREENIGSLERQVSDLGSRVERIEDKVGT